MIPARGNCQTALCWGRVHRRYAHDLLPLPFSKEALAHVATCVLTVQDRLRRTIAIENVLRLRATARGEHHVS